MTPISPTRPGEGQSTGQTGLAQEPQGHEPSLIPAAPGNTGKEPRRRRKSGPRASTPRPLMPVLTDYPIGDLVSYVYALPDDLSLMWAENVALTLLAIRADEYVDSLLAKRGKQRTPATPRFFRKVGDNP
jgi:hypothetical protein